MATSLIEEFERSWVTSLFGLLVFCGGVYLLTWNEVFIFQIVFELGCKHYYLKYLLH